MPGRKQPDPTADEVVHSLNDAAVVASDIGESLTVAGLAAAGAEWNALAAELRVLLARAKQLAR